MGLGFTENGVHRQARGDDDAACATEDAGRRVHCGHDHAGHAGVSVADRRAGLLEGEGEGDAFGPCLDVVRCHDGGEERDDADTLCVRVVGMRREGRGG